MRLTRKDWVRLLLLWLGGIDLRLTMLAVPPLIPLIHRDLHLDEKGVGALVSLPVLLLALASVPGALLIAKLGVRGALIAGLGFVAVFGALRGAGSTSVLFAATFLMGVGVAVTQPAFPSLVREWFPTRIAIATAVYSNGILIGETLPVTLTTPVGVLPLAHGDWRWALALWSILVLATCIAIGIAAPARVRRPATPARWWPSWLEGQALRIGLVIGMASAVYFGANAFIPDYLDQTGRHWLITPMLVALNAAQLLTAPAVALWQTLLTGRLGFIGAATLMGIAQIGIVLTPGPWVVGWALVLGFSTALAFIVTLTLPPRLAAAGDVHRMSATVFTIQYSTAFVVPLIAGALWDASGLALLAFIPGVAASAVMGWLALSLRIPSDDRRAAGT
ncbi:MAG: transporter, family, cyanate transporter [Chloroflexota bacterium]|nr:transporter, family, cyanate transporter [Chloroflexota bacterium]